MKNKTIIAHKACEHCGKKFPVYAQYKPSKYCGKKCYTDARKKRASDAGMTTMDPTISEYGVIQEMIAFGKSSHGTTFLSWLKAQNSDALILDNFSEQHHVQHMCWQIF